jgi:hypothetical protein
MYFPVAAPASLLILVPSCAKNSCSNLANSSDGIVALSASSSSAPLTAETAAAVVEAVAGGAVVAEAEGRERRREDWDVD